jgi:regulator of nucleoside diphosphate kinase
MSLRTRIPADPRPVPILDEHQVSRLLETARRASQSAPRLADQLFEEIERADLKAARDIPAGVVRMGSWITYRDEDNGAMNDIQLVYPEAADLKQHRISVVTPVGAALLGLSAGQEIGWVMSEGRIKRLTVIDVRQVRNSTSER